MSTQYKVYITPKVGQFTYGTEVEVSAEIVMNGIKTMKKSIDAGDYEVGVYTYGDINLKCINKNGLLSEVGDNRSIFRYARDLSKVRVDYSDSNGDITRFKGLINEEATKEDFDTEIITFRVLSNDSVIRTTKVNGGTVQDGVTVKIAIESILNNSRITAVLNFNDTNINPDNNIIIDNGSAFDNKTTKQALNDLLFASNSVLLIDSSDNMIVRSRLEGSGSVVNLYGPYDEKNRQNILKLSKYNRGKHRMFTSVVVNERESTNVGFSLDFGFRQKRTTMAFITNTGTEDDIAEKIVDEFKFPKLELEVVVPTYVAKNIDLLQTISLNYPLRIKRFEEKFLPVIGDAVIGDVETPLPYSFGNNYITPDIGFKVIEISEMPKSFETSLKLRQIGKNGDDGFLTTAGSCYIGFAKIGESLICGTGDICDKFASAPLGASEIGCTKLG